MGLITKTPKLVGNLIRSRREALGLSQRALGMLFTPPVTTQFISNIERGVTPLPPVHIPTLAKSLLVAENELMGLLEREYTLKLSGRVGHHGDPAFDHAGGQQAAAHVAPNDIAAEQIARLLVDNPDYGFMRNLYDAYRQADMKTKQAFATVAESILNVPKS